MCEPSLSDTVMTISPDLHLRLAVSLEERVCNYM